MAPQARQCLVRLSFRTYTPHTRLLSSFSFRPALGYGYESAAPAVTGSLSYGGCGAASSSLQWYRVSSFLLNPILTLRKHDAHPEDAPQRLMVRPGTLDACAELVLHRHSLRSPLFSLRSGASLLFAFDTLLPLSPFYVPLPPHHRPSTSPEHKIPAELSSAEILSNITAVLTSMGETETACRIRSCTSATSPHIVKIALHIAQN